MKPKITEVVGQVVGKGYTSLVLRFENEAVRRLRCRTETVRDARFCDVSGEVLAPNELAYTVYVHRRGVGKYWIKLKDYKETKADKDSPPIQYLVRGAVEMLAKEQRRLKQELQQKKADARKVEVRIEELGKKMSKLHQASEQINNILLEVGSMMEG
jgi:stringent starvation protein B